tara:strand:- start:404 stop:715 length:312 start_codon:yes stop_codon:yes gene_type:complete
MNKKDYKTLKSASKVSIAKEKLEIQKELKDSDGNVVQDKQERDVIYLKQKKWNPETGEAISDNKSELNLADLESQKANLESQIISIQENVDGLAEMIKDVKAL